MNVEAVNNPGYEPQQPRKSGGGGRSWLACFGIGCVVILLLCGVGAAIAWFTMGDYIMMGIDQGRLHMETIEMACENEQVIEKLGSPVVPDGFPPIPEVIPGEDGSQVQKTRNPIKGSEGSGVIIAEYYMKPGQPVERRAFAVEIDGEIIDMMDGGGSFELEINDGSDEESMEDTEVEAGEPVGAGSE